MDNGESSYRRFLNGDESAFGEIMEKLFRPLVFFINGYLHDVHASEDVAIDAFSELVVYPHRYNFKVSLKTYVFMIGRSRALDYLKHKKSHLTAELSDAENIEDEETLEKIILSDERRRTLNSALEKLPSDMRTAVMLVYFEDMSYDDAARVMKKNRKQIDNLIYRAKKELRTILGKDGEQLL